MHACAQEQHVVVVILCENCYAIGMRMIGTGAVASSGGCGSISDGTLCRHPIPV